MARVPPMLCKPHRVPECKQCMETKMPGKCEHGLTTAECLVCASPKRGEDDRPLVTRILQALPEQPPTPYSGWARYRNECADFVDRLRAALKD